MIGFYGMAKRFWRISAQKGYETLFEKTIRAGSITHDTHGGMTTVDSHNLFTQPAPSVRSSLS
jgi:hypothetical protein